MQAYEQKNIHFFPPVEIVPYFVVEAFSLKFDDTASRVFY